MRPTTPEISTPEGRPTVAIITDQAYTETLSLWRGLPTQGLDVGRYISMAATLNNPRNLEAFFEYVVNQDLAAIMIYGGGEVCFSLYNAFKNRLRDRALEDQVSVIDLTQIKQILGSLDSDMSQTAAEITSRLPQRVFQKKQTEAYHQPVLKELYQPIFLEEIQRGSTHISGEILIHGMSDLHSAWYADTVASICEAIPTGNVRVKALGKNPGLSRAVLQPTSEPNVEVRWLEMGQEKRSVIIFSAVVQICEEQRLLGSTARVYFYLNSGSEGSMYIQPTEEKLSPAS